MNETTMKMIEDLNDKHSHAISIFGGAVYVQTIDDVINKLPHVIMMSKFYEWHESVAQACRTFCHLCFIDPMLVEAYIGMKFERLIEEASI